MSAMTEDEARAKWCPFVRQLGTLIGRQTANEADRVISMGSQNRGYSMGGMLDNCSCIASQCMAWRWTDTTPSPPQRDEWELGYCGLAGTVHP